MKVLLHMCCGPCSTYPVAVLKDKGIDICGYFFNPNIHPYREFKKRLQSTEKLAELAEIPLIIDQEYGLIPFLQSVVFHEQGRCAICYKMRLEEVAGRAKKGNFDAFSSTLLYSRYQNHEQIVSISNAIAKKHGIAFYYEDFRLGWQDGIDESIRLDLYRQPYCGCIYSEQERYDKKLRKRVNKKKVVKNA